MSPPRRDRRGVESEPGATERSDPDAAGTSGTETSRSAEPARTDQLWVESADGSRRPFMRGIVIHSLMARGVSFDEADRAANTVRSHVRARGVIRRSEILDELRAILGDAPFAGDTNLPLAVDIRIHGKGKGQPFSKGVLSQSLLAAAIDPNDAFDVAREIERNLVRRGVREIDRRDLRKLAFETLSRRIDAQAAERYLVWRHYQDPDRPVILLLGGAAGVGKTALALEVAHRLGIGRVLSSDSVRQIMRIMLSPELAPAIHGSSYDAYKLFQPETLGDDPVIEGFRSQAATVSVGVRASIDRAIAENSSIVIDGVSVVPGAIDVEAYEEMADVVFLVVATLDPEAFATRFASREEGGQPRRAAHRYLLEVAERHGVPIVDNESFDRAVLFIIRHVTETLRNRRDFDIDAMLR